MVHADVTTACACCPDGARWAKIAEADAGPAARKRTLYLGDAELPHAGDWLVRPSPDMRITRDAGGGAELQFLHRADLDSVVLVTDAAGGMHTSRGFRPYGPIHDEVKAGGIAHVREEKGWIGERFDEETGLQYLNARFYDPELALFTQPDWFDPVRAGVGVNRFAYAGGDPVNASDPSGNLGIPGGIARGGLAGFAFGGTVSMVDDYSNVRAQALRRRLSARGGRFL